MSDSDSAVSDLPDAALSAREVPERRGIDLRRLMVYLALGVTTAISLFPLYWLPATALKARAELYAPAPTLVPQQPTLEAFASVLFDTMPKTMRPPATTAKTTNNFFTFFSRAEWKLTTTSGHGQ